MHLLPSRTRTDRPRRQRYNPRVAPMTAAGIAAGAIIVGLFVNPPIRMDALGSLGRAEASAVQATAATSPSLFGIAGVDLAALGYGGPDIQAVSVASLSAPLPELPMPRAADLRDRLTVGWSQLEALHQAEGALSAAVQHHEAAVAEARGRFDAAVQVRDAAAALVQERTAASDDLVARAARHLPLPRALAPAKAALDDAEAELAAATAALAEPQAELQRRWDAFEAHVHALERTRQELVAMDAHLRWLSHELARAQGDMSSTAGWLAQEARSRPDVPIVVVGPFEVHESIASSLRQLLDHAAADGIDLRGHAYRSTDRQIELRRQNCGTSDYDIWQRPPGECSPPTAIPGRSLHESGLAIDFRHGDQGITSHDSPAYQWLAAHAPSYGLHNLPSEPWHWSATGS